MCHAKKSFQIYLTLDLSWARPCFRYGFIQEPNDAVGGEREKEKLRIEREKRERKMAEDVHLEILTVNLPYFR